MANIAQHLQRLQLGAPGSRHRRSRRLTNAPISSVNASSISLQCSCLRRSLLYSLQCPKERVIKLHEDPDTSIPSLNPSFPAFQVAFAHFSNLLVAVDEEGAACIADSGPARQKSRWMAHHNAVFDVIWTQDNAQVLTAAGDLQIRIWDVETARVGAAPLSTLRGHDMSVKCVRQAPDNAHVFASGGRDGQVLMWDTRASGKPVASLAEVHAEPSPSRSSSPGVSFSSPIQKRRRRGPSTSASPRSVTCVEFGTDGNELITAGAVDAVVKFWDVRRFSSSVGRGKKKALATPPVPVRQISCSSREGARRGISSLALHQGGAAGATYLLVNVLNDVIALIDVGRRQHDSGHHEVKTLLRCSGHHASSFYSKATFSPDGDFIAGASADGVVYVWDSRVSASSSVAPPLTWSAMDVEQRLPCLALKGHASEVNGVAWNSQDFSQLASCSDDGTVRCWQVVGGQDQPLGSNATAETFELQQMPSNDVTEHNQQAQWVNWSAFAKQPDGYAYGVRCCPSSSACTSPAKPRETRTNTQRASPPVVRRTDEPRLHPVHVAPGAQQQLLSQESQDAQSQPKRKIQLKRKARPAAAAGRAQRTLLELWGR